MSGIPRAVAAIGGRLWRRVKRRALDAAKKKAEEIEDSVIEKIEEGVTEITGRRDH